MEYCNDPRVQAWFRDRLAESNGEMFPTMHLVKGLLANPTSANVAAVRASLFRKSIATSETASEILAAYTRGVNMSHRSRIELFAEIYERAAALPEPYASIESFNLKRGPEGMFWRQRTLSALTNFPEHAAAHSLLAMLGTDATEDSRDPHWRQQFRAGLVQLEGNSKASRELRNGAAQMRRLLDRKHGK